MNQLDTFTPRYVTKQELPKYGLPDVDEQENILSLVDAASLLVDEYCGRNDGDGVGSLVYTTYTERLLLQARNRNLVRTNFKPLVAIPNTTVEDLVASGSAGDENNFYTGVQANTVIRPDGSLSSIISASGRYGYPRRGEAAIYPDLNYGMNLLQVAAFYGGPPNWVTIDTTGIDWDVASGELWVPAGLYMSQYTEIMITYNSGFDPRNMPPKIKTATAMIIRNFLARGGGTTGIKGLNAAGSVNVQFDDTLIDGTVAIILDKFRNVIAY